MCPLGVLLIKWEKPDPLEEKKRSVVSESALLPVIGFGVNQIEVEMQMQMQMNEQR